MRQQDTTPSDAAPKEEQQEPEPGTEAKKREVQERDPCLPTGMRWGDEFCR